MQRNTLHRDPRCITNNYMERARKSRVLSIRIEESLLAAVRETARADGRSVSGEIVFFVRDKIAERHVLRGTKRRPLSNYLAGRDFEDLSREDYRAARKRVSKLLSESINRKAKRFERVRP